MAGNTNSGRIPEFHLSEKELETLIDQYKADLDQKKFARASWAHFIDYIGTTEDKVKEFIQKYSDKPESAYWRRARMLRGVLQFIRGQLCSAEAWNGQMSGWAKMLISQDYGDGIAYKSKETDSGPVEVKISFGGNDKRARDAAK